MSEIERGLTCIKCGGLALESVDSEDGEIINISGGCQDCDYTWFCDDYIYLRSPKCDLWDIRNDRIHVRTKDRMMRRLWESLCNMFHR